jgi:hypothetical protein
MRRLRVVQLIAGWLFVMGVVATLGAPAGAQGSSQPDTQDVADASCTAPAPHGLTDVPVGSYYDIAVGWLLEAGITQGTSPDKFSPSGKVTRAPMALFLWRAAGEPAPTGAHGFTDIPPNSSYETAVTWLIEQHITSGTGPGKYSPSNPVTRAQMATFLWRAAGEPAPMGAHGFTDIPPNSYYETAVTWLIEQHITSGTSPGKYSPSNPVTRAQMATFLWRSNCPPAPPISALAVGGSHSCAIKEDRTVSCSGRNTSGQLGNGTANQSLSPTPVTGLADVTTISAGLQTSCAVKSDGTAACWGYNASGQLGDGTLTQRLTPTPVAELTDVTAISAGTDHSCALSQSGTVSCWGANGNGQLGDNTLDGISTPKPVPGLSDVTAISVGDRFSCALTSGGTVFCWGYNVFGQLGNGTTDQKLTPAPVSGLSGVTAISAGAQHACAVKSDTTAVCWGDNSGRLDNGIIDRSSTPTRSLVSTTSRPSAPESNNRVR